MRAVMTALARHAAARPLNVALSDGRLELSYGAAYDAVIHTAAALRGSGARTVALALDNGPAWLILDLAALAARLRCVPVPGFFSPAQKRHLIADAAVDLLITDRPALYEDLLEWSGISVHRAPELAVAGRRLSQFQLSFDPSVSAPAATAKITYTSGTTGAPKGVCLDGHALGCVAESLAATVPLRTDDRHLSVLPLATLLENVGAYATLLAGGTCVVPPLATVGMLGSATFDCERMLDQLDANRASTAIVTPQIFDAMLDVVAAGAARARTLRFLAVGGAPLPLALLARAADVALPAYQGYGLSECASVVTLNTPAANRPGSVGRPLPHARVAMSDDGEVLVNGATLLGYCGHKSDIPDPWPTGDLGYVEDGYLHLTGRRKNIFITSFGRNVSPEWVESALSATPEIAQVWVHGEARPWNAAVITPAPGCDSPAVDAAVARVNRTLPDYARIGAWIRSERPFSYDTGELTVNGRLRREALLARYRAHLERLYKVNPAHVL